MKIKNEIEKKFAKHNECRTSEKNRKNHRKEQNRDDKIKMIF